MTIVEIVWVVCGFLAFSSVLSIIVFLVAVGIMARTAKRFMDEAKNSFDRLPDPPTSRLSTEQPPKRREQ